MNFDVARDRKAAEIARINEMSLSELADWMSRALCGEVVIPIGNIDEPPFGAVHRVYKELDPVVRQAIMDVVIRFLGEIEDSAASRWRGRGADNLLLLTEAVFLTMPPEAREPAVETVRRLVGPPFSPEVQDRALAVLVSLGHRASPEFWYRAADARPQERAVIAFQALSRINPELAMAWATQQDAPQARHEAIALALPWLVEQLGAARVDGLLRDVWGVLHEGTRQDIVLWSRPLGLGLADRAPPSAEPIVSAAVPAPQTVTTLRDQLDASALHRGVDAWNSRTSADATIALLEAWIEHGDPQDADFAALLQKLANQIVARRRGKAFLRLPSFRALYSSAIEKQRQTGVALDSVVDVALLQIEERNIGDPQARLKLIMSRAEPSKKPPGARSRSRSRA
jgi:hypothetical protein